MLMSVLLTFPSCQKDENVVDSNTKRSVQFSVVADSLSLPVTKMTNTSFENEEEIGVYAVLKKGNAVALLPSGNYVDNACFVYRDGKITPKTVSDAIMLHKGNELSYYLYAPYQAGITDATKIPYTVKSSQAGTGFKTSDLVTGSANGSYDVPEVNVSFTHILSYLEFAVQKAGSYKVQKTELLNIFSGGDFKAGGTFTADITSSRQTVVMNMEENADFYLFRAIVPAQSISSGQDLFAVYTDINNKKTIFANTAVQLTAGNKYVYNKGFSYIIETKTEGAGTVTGGGTFPLGTRTTVTATANDQHQDFLGWFDADSSQAASMELSYLFDVVENRTLTAKFKEKPVYTLTVSNGTGSGNYHRDEIIPITPTVPPGKFFWFWEVTPAGILQTGEWTANNSVEIIRNSTANAVIKDVPPLYYEIEVTQPAQIAASGGTVTVAGKLYKVEEGKRDAGTNITVSLQGSSTGFTVNGNQVTASNNQTMGERNISLTASHIHGNDLLTDQVTVTQAAGVITHKLTISTASGYIPSGGGSKNISGVYYTYWNSIETARENVSPALSGSATGFSISGTSVTAAANNGTSSRSINVTGTHNGTASAPITITQDGSIAIEYSSWSTTSLSPTANPATVGASGGSSSLSCKANQSRYKYTKQNGVTINTETETQTMSVSPTWSKVSGSGSQSSSTVSFGNNTSANSQSGVYRASYDGKTGNVTVYQSAGSKSYGSWSSWRVSVSASTYNISANGGNSSIYASAERSRSYTWNGVGGSGGTEYDSATPGLSNSNGAFSLSGSTLSVGANTSTSSRSTRVTASYGGSSDYVDISQSGGTYSYGSWSVSISSSRTSFTSAAGSATLTASASRTKYIGGVAVDTEYATPTISGSGTGFSRSGMSVSVAKNETASSRSVTYTASHGGVSKSVTLTQDRAWNVDVN